jgi:hypothetical protein
MNDPFAEATPEYQVAHLRQRIEELERNNTELIAALRILHKRSVLYAEGKRQEHTAEFWVSVGLAEAVLAKHASPDALEVNA